MPKLTIKGRAKQPENVDDPQQTGNRITRWEDDDKMIGDVPRSKKKSLLKDRTRNSAQGAMQFPHDYIDKMHVSKSNWLSRRERGRDR
jgi:hypothetical protein|uniref:Uncharacterized protein n=1 Tax=Myoviridae sp. ctshb19 TaxID=2825194 RepID=A0A8S5UGX6_9CAUD|nr:MAG TPA: hypothetical protein [Myoviridae sp. ctshb19]